MLCISFFFSSCEVNHPTGKEDLIVPEIGKMMGYPCGLPLQPSQIVAVSPPFSHLSP